MTGSNDSDLSTSRQFWIPQFKLYPFHKEIITKGEWLTDDIISAGQDLIKAANPTIGGLENTILGETLSFSICKGDFVQILNVARNHWITVSSLGIYIGRLHVHVFCHVQNILNYVIILFVLFT